MGIDPHMDPGLVPAGCPACHEGHGVSRSPMLPAPQSEVCQACHGTEVDVDRAIREGLLTPGRRPPLLADALSQAYAHPIDPAALSRQEPGAVTCSSCHSPHRSSEVRALRSPTGRKPSTRDPNEFEYELCQRCHGSGGVTSFDYRDISRLLDPSSRSYHPVQAPAGGSSASIRAELAGREINCTDCHGNSDPTGAKGPHGSNVAFLLRAEYTTLDGSAETPAAYALCYLCHERDLVLEFPLHRSHVVDLQASCATCHSPHGSVGNRALIRFGEDSLVVGAAPSTETGRLAFLSSAPGEGSCYLTCHGYDHAPESYGGPADPTEIRRGGPRIRKAGER